MLGSFKIDKIPKEFFKVVSRLKGFERNASR
jgi:hypothetical protein